MNKIRRLFLGILPSLAIVQLTSGGLTAAAETLVPATEMQALLRNAKIVDSSYPLRISVHEEEALVSTRKNPKANETDGKVDAVLMAKALMDAYPTQILRVKVLFNNYEENKADQIVVTKGDVKSFGAGAIDEKTLLNSLDCSVISALSQDGEAAGVVPYKVSPGVLADERQLLLGHIKLLEKRGTNVKPFQIMFEQIEASVREHKDKTLVEKQINDLDSRLKEQNKLIQQASAIQKTSAEPFSRQRRPGYMQGNKPPFPQQGTGSDQSSSRLDPWRMFRRLKAFSPEADGLNERRTATGIDSDRQKQMQALKSRLTRLVENKGSIPPNIRPELARIFLLMRNGRMDEARQAIERLEAPR